MKSKFKIGDIVAVKATTVMEYNEKNYRRPVKYQCKEVHNMFVCGRVRKHEGTYSKAMSFQSFDYDYTPPTFTTTKHHWLYECRKEINNKPVLVAEEDMIFVSRMDRQKL